MNGLVAGSRGVRWAALLLVAWLGCVTPIPIVDADDWFEVRTATFTLAGNLPEAELLALARELALFDALVRRITNTRIAESGLPAHFYVLRSVFQARQFMPRGAAGVIYPTLDGYRAVLSRQRNDVWTRTILLHEYTHYVLRGDRRTPLPAWYDEGTCEFFANTRMLEDVIELGGSSELRVSELYQYGVQPLADLFGPEARRHPGFYATAWALVHFLNTSPERNAPSRAYVERLVRGEPWREAFEASFASDLEDFERSFRDHVAFLKRGGRRGYALPRERIPVPQDPTLRPLAPAEALYQLGEVWRRFQGDDVVEIPAAEGLYARALELDAGHDRARAALAWTRARQGRFEEATAVLAALDPDAARDPVVALDLARVSVLRAAGRDAAAVEAARALVERAIALAPERPGGHAELGRLLWKLGERDAAVRALERARELGGWDERLDVELARLHLEQGATERAIALLRPVAADAHAGEIVDEARRLLESVEP